MKYKIYIGLPLYDGNISSDTFLGLIELFDWFKEKKIDYKFQILTKESLVSRARNTLVAMCLDDTNFNATHFFFVDSDIGFSYKNFERLLNYDQDVVCGVYPQKVINWNMLKNFKSKELDSEKFLTYNVNFIDKNNISIDKNGFAEIKEAATGFLLIKIAVLLKMQESYPELKYKPRDTKLISEKNSYDLFKVGIYQEEGFNEYLSEDFYFSKLWKNLGGKIFADMLLPLTHSGKYNYKGSVLSSLHKK